ncbi:MAG TPA: sn-glycerol-3-phosphate ABC transporter ATP-binding protein UgpC [Candidatus Acidoferrum sp.]|nr:sn-glycerol-3-phosphate ABC transporter ATP-binding protein UgpC [Candidatus Acidoferrum sp.]
MATIEIGNVAKSFGSVQVLHDIQLSIPDGEFLVLVGPSGCGKSTLLRIIAGLEHVTDGMISIDGRDVTDLPAKARDIAMVFQSYALYPHMTVAENMAFSLRVRRADKKLIEERVQAAAKILNLTEYLKRRPAELSGGQRQRVAMGRAIVRDPKVFLFDEPLSNLDAKLRVSMRSEIKALHQRLKTTTIYVTHDQVEAMTMADRIVVLRDGRVEQIGTPLELYDSPANVFVAEFIGSPAMNLLPAKLSTDGGRPSAVINGGSKIELPAQLAGTEGQAILVGIRPEHLSVGYAAGGLTGKVALVEPTGAQVQIIADVGGRAVTALLNERVLPPVGSDIALAPKPDAIHAFDEASGRRL